MIPVNVEMLLAKQRLEDNRVEFKKGWNPDSIYHSICAFANDIDDLGGGYILVGVETDEKSGLALRPVSGLPEEQIDRIQNEMVGFNKKIDPYYMPRTSVEMVDGRYVFVIWVASGQSRPYSVPVHVTDPKSRSAYYVRCGANSIVAEGDVLNDLHNLASREPFDERGNEAITESDIEPILVGNYLRKVNSRLYDTFRDDNLIPTLEQMNLLTGPSERRLIKNVAAMMFCEHPERFFPYTQVDVVTFHEGKLVNPSNFTEVTFRGPVPQLIKQTLDYLKVRLGDEHVIKREFDPQSLRYFDYPMLAIEEALVNCLYHRSYQIHEPVEVTIEPHRVSFLSFPGPDRTISDVALANGSDLRSRRYTNRRLGDFLKELGFTEGRSTGIPTIQLALSRNGSPRATFETNAERSYFLIDIPIHPKVSQADLREQELQAMRSASSNKA